MFILDFLYWPHDKVSHDVGYLDTSILTYRNLGQYGFFDTLRSGQVRFPIRCISASEPQADPHVQSTVMQTHLCQAHSSSVKSPTHPRNGVFSCDQAVQELCRWFSPTVDQTRLNLRVPGFIFGYGAYNKKYLARLRKGMPTITSTTLHRSVKPLKRDAALVAPRSFPFVSISAAEAESQPPFGFEWDVDHPSSYAYAGTHGGLRGALKGLSYALTLVSRRIFRCPVSIRSARICSSVVHAHGLAGPSVGRKGSPRRLATGGAKKFSFQRKARANYRTRLLGHRIAYSLDAEWDQRVSHAYRAKLQRRGRHTLVDSDGAVARDSFSLSKLAIMLDDIRLAAGIDGEAK